MEKRVFLAIVLSFAVLTLYQAYFAPAPVEPPSAATETLPPAAEVPGQTPPPAQVPTVPSTSQPEPAEPAEPAGEPAAAPLVADTEVRDIVVETDAIRAVFSTRGATLTSWQLKDYVDQHGAPLDLVPADIPDTLPRPFTVATDDAAISATLASALFQPSRTSLSLSGTATGVISFEYRDASGLNARKTYHFQPEGKPYVLGVEASVDVGGASRPVTLEWGPALSLGYHLNGSREIAARALIFRDGEWERIQADTLLEEPRYSGGMTLAGVEDHYFMTVALPGGQAVDLDYLPVTLPVPGNTEGLERNFVDFSISVPGAAAIPFFLGPKELDVLRDVDPQFARAIDFGVFAFLVVPLLQALKWLHAFIGNWGFSIIVLTVIINLLIFPLRHRSMVSMRKMQAIQPEIKAIQERYKKYKVTDPERQKMNQEMMALYKQKGVNPASGCVPMLLTMPVLFAFYAMLQVAIELRGAPFIWWIHDLSAHDPYYVWPLLMGASMFFQQRMSPTTADPVQAKVFMFMPVMFTFMFLWFPAGLVIYWLTSNLMAIGQQYITNRVIGAPPRPAVAAAAPEAAAKPKRKSKS